MFPNVRLMIVAVFASIMGISSALGLFAEFRVSHDLFVRESSGNTPLQLGANEAAPAAATFELRFRLDKPHPVVIEAVQEPVAPDHDADVGTPGPAAAAATAPKTPAPSASSPSAPEIVPIVASVPAPAATPASKPSAPEAAPIVASAPVSAASAISSTSAPQTASPNAFEAAAPIASSPEPTTTTAAPAVVAGPPNSAATGGAVGKATQQAAEPNAIADIVTRMPAELRPVQEAMPKSKIAPESARVSEPAKAAKTARPRVTRPRRFQRARTVEPAASVGQSFTAAQPAYQWTPQSGLQSPQPARRRVIVKRVRPARKAVVKDTAPQAAAGSTVSLTNQW